MSSADGRWSIDIAAVQHIVATVESTIAEFDADARLITEAIQAASDTVGASQTATALTVVNETLTAETVAAKAHAINASSQTSAAVNAYIQGDLDMAQNAANRVGL